MYMQKFKFTTHVSTLRSALLSSALAVICSTSTCAFANDLELDVREQAEIEADALLNLDPRPAHCNLGTRDTLEVCDETNAVRESYRKGRLRSDSKLNRLAMEYARRLYKYNNDGKDNKLTHNIPGYEFNKRMQRARVTPPYGENIAVGYRDPASVVRGWKSSRGHFRNMVNGSYTKIGAAHYKNFWVQIFSR